MSHGTISSTQIDLDTATYDLARKNPYINGLLNDGWRFGSDGHTDGTELQIIHYYFDGGNWNPPSAPNQTDYINAALLTWSNVANIQFTEVSNINDAEIVLHNTTSAAIAHTAGWSGTPNQALNENTTDRPFDKSIGNYVPIEVGDVGQVHTYIPSNHTDYKASPSFADWGPDSAAWIDIIHEVGHALGLKHPHDGGTTGSPLYPDVDNANDVGDGYNQNIYTIMSYVHPSVTFRGYPDTPMAFDIAAIQVLYGANKTFASGDDTYRIPEPTGAWGQNGRAFSCIWDTGGTDQIVYDGKSDCTIDLRPATLTSGIGAAGYFSWSSDGRALGRGFSIAGDILKVLPDHNGVSGVIIENARGGSGDDHIRGNGVDNDLRGRGGSDILYGLNGHDQLRGGAGLDTLYGGLGSDEYFLDDVNRDHYGRKTYDKVSETGGGFDTVYVAFLVNGPNSYQLTAGVEQGGISTTRDGFDLIGNGQRNQLFGNIGNDVLEGGGGADYLNGGDGNDSLHGQDGKDTLDGWNGYDVLAGGNGDDVYILNDLSPRSGVSQYDRVVETSAGALGGIDTVHITPADRSVTSYTLTPNVENGYIDYVDSGDSGFNLYGNGKNNQLYGNVGFDVLRGAGGNDRLDGGGGHDLLAGGLGDDVYILSQADWPGTYDEVQEADGGGSDIVIISVDGFDGTFYRNYTLPNYVENATVADANGLGAAYHIGFNLVGNFLDNFLTGGDQDDELFGSSGNDTLSGGAGHDALMGGIDNDLYILQDVTLVEGFGYLYDTVEDARPDSESGNDGGFDTVRVAAVEVAPGTVINAYTLTEFVEAGVVIGDDIFFLTGNDLDNQLFANGAGNQLTGLGGRDLLVGGARSDILDGGENQDRLNGAGGKDHLIGGDDHDTFIYKNIAASRPGAANRDFIADFTQGNVETRDVIDLSGIDANGLTGRVNEAFKFIGTNAFHSHGTVHVFRELRAGVVHASGGDHSIIEGDVNGDGAADFQIEFGGVFSFSVNDFVL